MLENEPVITFDDQTYEVTWNIDKNGPLYVPSLAKTLVELHQIPSDEVAAVGLKVLTPGILKQDVLNRLELVKSEEWKALTRGG